MVGALLGPCLFEMGGVYPRDLTPALGPQAPSHAPHL